jgi:hypothetical protein
MMGSIRMSRDDVRAGIYGFETIELLKDKLVENLRRKVGLDVREDTITGLQHSLMNDFINTFRITIFNPGYWQSWQPKDRPPYDPFYERRLYYVPTYWGRTDWRQEDDTEVGEASSGG